MHRSHKIRLRPDKEQEDYFRQACGTSRFAWNWALNRSKELYEAGLPNDWKVLNAEFNALKKTDFAWAYEVTSQASNNSILCLGGAFKSFFKKETGYPKFKKKGQKDSFYLPAPAFKVKDESIWITKLGTVKMEQSLRFDGKIISATISRRADKWYVSIVVEIPGNDLIEIPVTRNDEGKSENQATGNSIGIDLGINYFAALSNGEFIENPRFMKSSLKRLRRLSKNLSRKQKGSKNWYKAKMKLARFHAKIADRRDAFLHELTTDLTRRFDIICLEDLHVKGLCRTRLAQSMYDVACGEFRRQISYKSNETRFVGRFDTTSKICSACGERNNNLKRGDRVFRCVCGHVEDRDLNASKNIEFKGLRNPVRILRRLPPDVMPVETKALARCPKRRAKPSSVKQEI